MNLAFKSFAVLPCSLSAQEALDPGTAPSPGEEHRFSLLASRLLRFSVCRGFGLLSHWHRLSRNWLLHSLSGFASRFPFRFCFSVSVETAASLSSSFHSWSPRPSRCVGTPAGLGGCPSPRSPDSTYLRCLHLSICPFLLGDSSDLDGPLDRCPQPCRQPDQPDLFSCCCCHMTSTGVFCVSFSAR